jgi:predicted metal-dependent hydrolase
MHSKGLGAASEFNVGDITHILSGFAFKSEQFTTDPNEGMPLIRIRDLKSNGTACRYLGEFDAAYVIQEGDIVVGMDGEFLAVRWAGENALLNQRVLRLNSSQPDTLDEEYLFYRIQPELKKLERAITGTTVKHLSTKDIKRLVWELPPLDEQRRIAEVLRSMDEAIAAGHAEVTAALKVFGSVRDELLLRARTEFEEIRIADALEKNRGEKVRKLQTSAYQEKGKYPIVDQPSRCEVDPRQDRRVRRARLCRTALMPTLRVGRTDIPYELRRTATDCERRITVTPGLVEVLALTTDDDDAVQGFLTRKRQWLFDTVREMEEAVAARPVVPRFMTGSKIPFRGRLSSLTVRRHSGRHIEVAHRNGFLVDLPDWITDEAADAVVASRIKLWLRRRVRLDIQEIAAAYGARFGLKPRSIRVAEFVGGWGSCGRAGSLTFDWRLVFAPKKVLEYVVVHELAHLRHRSHGAAFWAFLELMAPDFERPKAWLESNGGSLDAQFLDRPLVR